MKKREKKGEKDGANLRTKKGEVVEKRKGGGTTHNIMPREGENASSYDLVICLVQEAEK